MNVNSASHHIMFFLTNDRNLERRSSALMTCRKPGEGFYEVTRRDEQLEGFLSSPSGQRSIIV
ncbi:hypothetical protein E2C01_045515 [Portunus trituberculatus]|uniref:Uncharacterized protein n=1 Tax=Portunus trituberculatus TaxID=210409 RepID=A0A5B7G335_PORTR|nr:hypothetical protein [Portunus trituberculatus]